MAFASLLVCLSLLCSAVVVAQECSFPLGMENKAIRDSQITASSEFDSAHGASNGRLNFQSGGGKTGAWSAGANDGNQWLQVDLGQSKKVTGIKTQGRQEADQWVTNYTVSYSNDGRTFTSYRQNAVLQGNGDRNTVVSHVLSPPFNARYIRLHPKTYHSFTSMRMELLGCPAPGLTSGTCSFLKTAGFCPNGNVQELCPAECPQACRNYLPDDDCNILEANGRCREPDMFSLCRKSCLKCSMVYASKGCWIDVNADRIMATFLHQDFSDPNIVKLCAQRAAARGFSTFGVEAGGQCFSGANAGDTFKKHGQAPNGDCINGKGASFRMSVYQFI